MIHPFRILSGQTDLDVFCMDEFLIDTIRLSIFYQRNFVQNVQVIIARKIFEIIFTFHIVCARTHTHTHTRTHTSYYIIDDKLSWSLNTNAICHTPVAPSKRVISPQSLLFLPQALIASRICVCTLPLHFTQLHIVIPNSVFR